MCTFSQANAIFLNHAHGQLSGDLSEEVRKYLTHKVPHTYGVLSACQNIIANDPNLSHVKEKTRLEFEIAALLHDIGRFHQHDGEKILSGKIFSHGEKGYGILKMEGINNPRILLAIKHHESFDLSGLENELDYITADTEEKERIYRICTLLRDADKLQSLEYLLYDPSKILNYSMKANGVSSLRNSKIGEYCHSELVSESPKEGNMQDPEINSGGQKHTLSHVQKIGKSDRDPKSVSEACFDSIKKKQQLDKKIVQTSAEYALYHFSWIFDLHHEGTKIALRQMRFRERFGDILMKMGVKKEVTDLVRG